MVFNATFSNISAIPWRSALLVEETRVHEETQRPVTSYRQALSHNVMSAKTFMCEIRTHNFSGDRDYSTLQVYQLSYSQVGHIPPKMSDTLQRNVRQI